MRWRAVKRRNEAHEPAAVVSHRFQRPTRAILSCLVALLAVLGGLRAARYLSLGPDGPTRHERIFALRRDAAHQYLTALKYERTGGLERPYSSYPETRRPVGYAVLLSWFLRHVSESRTTSVVLASVFGILNSLAVFLVVLQTVGRGRPYASGAATLVAGALPENLQLSVTGAMEPAFSLLFTAAMVLVARIVATAERPVPGWIPLLAGVLLGLGTWTRGNALLLPVAAVAFALLLWGQGRPCWRRVGVLLTLPIVASIGLQMLTTHAIAGRYALPTIGLDTAAHYLVHAAVGWKRTGSLQQGDDLGRWVGEDYQIRYLKGGEDDEVLLEEAMQRMRDGLREAPLHVLGKFFVNWGQMARVGTFSGSKWEGYLSSSLILATVCLFGLCLLSGFPTAQGIAIFWLVVGVGAACTTGQKYRVFAHSELILAYAWVAVPLLWKQRDAYLRATLVLALVLAPVAATFVIRGGLSSWTFDLSRFTTLYLLGVGMTLVSVGMLRAFVGRQAPLRPPPSR